MVLAYDAALMMPHLWIFMKRQGLQCTCAHLGLGKSPVALQKQANYLGLMSMRLELVSEKECSSFKCTAKWFIYIITYVCVCIYLYLSQSVSSVTQSCLTLCDPMDCSTTGLPVHHQLPELAQTHVHWVGDAIQPSHPLSSPSLPAFNLSQHQGLFQWVGSLHQVAKVLEFQLQHSSFQWIFRTDFL